MFKSSFAKYLSAFVIIIFTSFIILSGIITAIIHYDITNDKKTRLERVSLILSEQLEGEDFTDFSAYVTDKENLGPIIAPIVGYDVQLDVLVTDADGKVLLTTYGAHTPDGLGDIIKVSTDTDLGEVNISVFDVKTDNVGSKFSHEGNIDGLISEKSMVYGREVVKGGARIGYVFAFSSTVREDSVISVVRRAVTNSCIVVMIAAVLAAYIMTERLIRPLRLITDTAKNYGKGDFAERIPVEGNDEVAELATALNNMADSLDSLEKMRNSFLANISHDLRTPLTMIKGYSEIMRDLPGENNAENAQIIIDETTRLSDLVSDLLDLSKLQAGTKKPEPEIFDLSVLARDTLRRYDALIRHNGYRILFETEGEAEVSADRGMILQVIYNLINNAVNYTGESLRVRVSITLKENSVRLSVADDGEGIEPDQIESIWDRYYRVDKVHNRAVIGTGLGLSIVKGILEAHGALYGVESAVGVGSVFWIELPLVKQE